MENKEKIDYLLSDIKELEKLVAEIRDTDLYPVSFFNQTFELSYKIINELHSLETDQVEMLRKQMEEHQKRIQSIPLKEATVLPDVTPVPPAEPEVKEEMPTVTVPEKTGISLNEVLEKQHLSDFRKAFSLNDRFRFRRELFGGDEARMNKAITELNDIHSYEASINYIQNELKWNPEDLAAADFIKLLEKRFL